MLDVCTALSALEIIPIKDEFTQFLGKKFFFFTGLQKQLQEFWFTAVS